MRKGKRKRGEHSHICSQVLTKPLTKRGFEEVFGVLEMGKWLISLMVRERGLEPLREIPLDPKSSASTSSATLAEEELSFPNN